MGNINFNKKSKRRIGINITPFVDVMLVLLLVFMISMPMFTGSIEINLPETSNASSISENQNLQEPIIITISKTEKIYLADEEFTQEQLLQKLKSLLKENKDIAIYVKGDKEAQYGKIVQVISFINAAGFSRVSLLTTAISENLSAIDKNDYINNFNNFNNKI
ncbi:MAG: biopolymer transporter ExbD [Rickettsiales bacterium]